jgi:RluA family pseudouridine synthase
VTPKILFQSDAVLVIDKPAGLAVHRGPRGGASLEDALPALQMGKRHLPQPAHRLDQDTAGCLVLGRTKPAMAELGGFFARGEAQKTYWALLKGSLPGESGEVDAALLKTSSAKAGWRMVVDAKGQAALTRWRVLGRGPEMSWVEFQPRTGRTHQLRAHAAHLGHPILGDARYGGGEGAMQLLARRIVLPGGIDVTAPVPAHMLRTLRACGG